MFPIYSNYGTLVRNQELVKTRRTQTETSSKKGNQRRETTYTRLETYF